MISSIFDVRAFLTSFVFKMIIDKQILNSRLNQNGISMHAFNQYDNKNDQNEYKNQNEYQIKYSNDY